MQTGTEFYGRDRTAVVAVSRLVAPELTRTGSSGQFGPVGTQRLIGFTRQPMRQAKELAMVASNMSSASAKSSQARDATADRGDHGPMPQQDAGDAHGHEMHPQRLVQLVGCHDSNAGKHQVPHRLS
jgi:hypothetical protein